MKRILGALALAMLPGVALAQTDPVEQDRLYVSDPAACQLLETKGVSAFEDLDFTTLSFEQGIQSLEFHCNFFDVKTKPGNAFTLVSAVCETPGENYPDMFSIGRYNDDTIQVTSMSDSMFSLLSDGEGAGEAEENPLPLGVTLYHRCENLSELPR
ncbi:hypothetical protein PSQ90_15920 [Devosia rhodophyticola]|uniref:Uncharacterized protein n=1 Tax=Devosia rhodophyticola TaxID=3026423 RepID=A0ABY7YWX8_9HYPH|nr:hypothetical protein [Devosia rhodophyticola]WDR05717.1 hypothetical protein PSQ90_15920 [Devosia rhodophyticola]